MCLKYLFKVQRNTIGKYSSILWMMMKIYQLQDSGQVNSLFMSQRVSHSPGEGFNKSIHRKPLEPCLTCSKYCIRISLILRGAHSVADILLFLDIY